MTLDEPRIRLRRFFDRDKFEFMTLEQKYRLATGIQPLHYPSRPTKDELRKASKECLARLRARRKAERKAEEIQELG